MRVVAAGRTVAALLGALALLVTAGCRQSDDDAATSSTTTSTTTVGADTDAAERALPDGVRLLAADDDIYALAEDFEPGEPGEVIAVQPAETALDATVWRVLYHSESLTGDDIAVSGFLAVPPGDAPRGGRAVLSWAHGTTGIADGCAPSLELEARSVVMAVPFLERGMVVAATDYEGLGTPGRHPYLVGESEGRGVLDIARAARHLEGLTGASDQVLIWGHSQGGQAALFANQLAATWAPELEVLGAVAGAPPSQLPLMARFIQSGPGGFFLALVVAGWSAAYPEADPAQVLTPAGLDRLDVVDDGCLAEVAAAWGAATTEDLLIAGGADQDPWPSLFQANDPGHVVGEGPVLIIHGGADEIVPVATSQALEATMCSIGQVVERRVYEDQTHVGVVAASLADMLQWIDARLAGQPIPTSCP